MSFDPVKGNLQSAAHGIQEIMTLKDLMAVDNHNLYVEWNNLKCYLRCADSIHKFNKYSQKDKSFKKFASVFFII
jgi:hypothetical protein